MASKTETTKSSLITARRAELSAADCLQRDRQVENNRGRPTRPESKFVDIPQGDDTVKRTIQAADDQDNELYSAAMLEAFGTNSEAFLNSTSDNYLRVMSPSRQVSSGQYNASVALMASIEPVNELEATLASQMVAANECAFRCMRHMVATDVSDHHKMYGELANKFLRTFAVQFEALAKMRRGGEQVVRHVHVGDGGQAVIAGTVNTGRGGSKT